MPQVHKVTLNLLKLEDLQSHTCLQARGVHLLVITMLTLDSRHEHSTMLHRCLKVLQPGVQPQALPLRFRAVPKLYLLRSSEGPTAAELELLHRARTFQRLLTLS